MVFVNACNVQILDNVPVTVKNTAETDRCIDAGKFGSFKIDVRCHLVVAFGVSGIVFYPLVHGDEIICRADQPGRCFGSFAVQGCDCRGREVGVIGHVNGGVQILQLEACDANVGTHIKADLVDAFTQGDGGNGDIGRRIPSAEGGRAFGVGHTVRRAVDFEILINVVIGASATRRNAGYHKGCGGGFERLDS